MVIGVINYLLQTRQMIKRSINDREKIQCDCSDTIYRVASFLLLLLSVPVKYLMWVCIADVLYALNGN